MGNAKSKKNAGSGEDGAVVEEAIAPKKAGTAQAGLVKPKKYDWKDSNLALFGSDLEKKIKKASAKTEKAWEAVGQTTEPKLFVWRIEKFKVKSWPEEDYGKFFSGDSYIVLNVYKKEDQLMYDVHFWIGKRSTQDEYGTAAYKTVELDTFLDDKAIQHREVQGFESPLFKSYFPILTFLKGGCATGFRHVEPQKYTPRLLRFHGRGKGLEAVEVKISKNALTGGDVFILDLGLEAIQWNGSTSNKDERIKAAEFLQKLESERNGKCKTETVDQTDISETHAFYTNLTDDPYEKKAPEDENFNKSLFRLSDEAGKMNFSLVSEGSIPPSMLDEKDVYIIDNGKQVFVYVGKDSSKEEKKKALQYAHGYLQGTLHPLVPVTCLRSGQDNDDLKATIDSE